MAAHRVLDCEEVLGKTRELVGAIGFEPTTPRSRTECSTRLSHAPTRREPSFYLTSQTTRGNLDGCEARQMPDRPGSLLDGIAVGSSEATRPPFLDLRSSRTLRPREAPGHVGPAPFLSTSRTQHTP